MSEFRSRTINGITWSIVSRIGRLALTFVIGVILARLLSPREFGLVAMITVITSFAAIFAELGFSAALVQKPEVDQEHLSSVFWLNLGAGLVLTLAFSGGRASRISSSTAPCVRIRSINSLVRDLYRGKEERRELFPTFLR